MKSSAIAAIVAAVSMPLIAAAPAQAQYYDQRGGYDPRGYDERGYGDPRASYDDRRHDDRRDYRDGRTYRGRDVTYYHDCRRSSGTTGLLAGGAGGALIGAAVGASPLGVILGAVGGGLLGKHLDKRNDAEQNYRNGC